MKKEMINGFLFIIAIAMVLYLTGCASAPKKGEDRAPVWELMDL